MLGEGAHDLLALAEAQQAVVDEHAGQLVADRPVQQRCDHRRIDAAGEPEQHLAVADLGAHPRDRIFDDVAELQSASQPQISRTKRSSMRAPCARVGHFGMELHAVVAAPLVAIAAKGMLAVLAVTMKPGGSSVTRSPWLIHTSSAGRPAASRRSREAVEQAAVPPSR